MADPSEAESPPLAFPFDAPPPGDRRDWPELLGGKGTGLAMMRDRGIPVPPGFTIPTTVGRRVVAEGWFDDLDRAVRRALVGLEESVGRRLGAGDLPLLVSVRSGAPMSMPGMMDTVLNVGMSAAVARSLGRWGSDERFGWDTYRRFVEGYASIVAGAPQTTIASIWVTASGDRPIADLSVGELEAAATGLRAGLADAGFTIPDDPHEQVRRAIEAVFASWNAPRAVAYRRREGLSALSGTAATVQAMVFGNLGPDSGTGVVFTRDPSTGADGLMGDFLVGGQGEDVVAGTHHTHPIAELARRWPVVAGELTALASKLEHDLGDVADIEFTVERGRLWILQARVGKRSPQAAIRLAVAMAEDVGFPLDRAGAVARVSDLLDDPPVIATTRSAAAHELLASGLAASPGHASGRVCVDPDEALRRAEQGEPVILIRRETSPADVHGMAVANGLVTQLGGLVSHAAVVARAWGIPAVVGVAELTVDDDGIRIGSRTIGLGETITVDGDRGRILLGAHAVDADEMAEVVILRAWRDELRRSGDGSLGAAVADDLRVGPTESATSVDVLRALALKGMATAETVASFLLAGPDTVVELLGEAVTRDQARAGPGDRYLLTPDGTVAVDAAFAAEAVAAAPAIEPHLARFHQLNGRFKEVVASWQMRELGGEQVMNDHTDSAYDASILRSLSEEIHTGIVDVIAAIEESVPRLGAYRTRLQIALAGLDHGDLELMAHPLRDSYHTVWFELHEELIRLSGRNRADEAAAGRA